MLRLTTNTFKNPQKNCRKYYFVELLLRVETITLIFSKYFTHTFYPYKSVYIKFHKLYRYVKFGFGFCFTEYQPLWLNTKAILVEEW